MFMEYIAGTEEHTSSWHKFIVKGLNLAREDHAGNRHDRHHNYQCFAGEVPAGTLFTIWWQSGNKHGAQHTLYGIYQVLAEGEVPTHLRFQSQPYGFEAGGFAALIEATTPLMAKRLLGWMTTKPQGVPLAGYVELCRETLGLRGVTQLPPEKVAALGAAD